ncbi:MAG: glycosyltransferase [Rhodospirillales bacterium]|nr:glycosyltransferase [Rhodospirillales bacterium]
MYLPHNFPLCTPHIMVWAGESGKRYDFAVSRAAVGWLDEPAVFIFARHEGNCTTPLFVGQTRSLHRRFGMADSPCPDVLSRAQAMGMTHVHVRFEARSERVRQAEVRDLVAALQPALNSSAIADAESASSTVAEPMRDAEMRAPAARLRIVSSASRSLEQHDGVLATCAPAPMNATAALPDADNRVDAAFEGRSVSRSSFPLSRQALRADPAREEDNEPYEDDAGVLSTFSPATPATGPDETFEEFDRPVQVVAGSGDRIVTADESGGGSLPGATQKVPADSPLVITAGDGAYARESDKLGELDESGKAADVTTVHDQIVCEPTTDKTEEIAASADVRGHGEGAETGVLGVAENSCPQRVSFFRRLVRTLFGQIGTGAPGSDIESTRAVEPSPASVSPASGSLAGDRAGAPPESVVPNTDPSPTTLADGSAPGRRSAEPDITAAAGTAEGMETAPVEISDHRQENAQPASAVEFVAIANADETDVAGVLRNPARGGAVEERQPAFADSAAEEGSGERDVRSRRPRERAPAQPASLAADRQVEAKRSLGLDPAMPVGLFAGEISYTSGVDLLIEAIITVRHDKRQAQFVFAGEGTVRHRLEERVRAEGVQRSCRFLGHVSAAVFEQLLVACDFVVIPARAPQDGELARASIAHGKPVLTTHQSVLDCVQHNRNGLVAYDNPGSLVWGIREILGPRYEELRRCVDAAA